MLCIYKLYRVFVHSYHIKADTFPICQKKLHNSVFCKHLPPEFARARILNSFSSSTDTLQAQIENKLNELTSREDIAIILITQNVAIRLQSILESYKSPLPAILEIPSKDHPYDLKKVYTFPEPLFYYLIPIFNNLLLHSFL